MECDDVELPFPLRIIAHSSWPRIQVWIYGGSLNNGSADRFLYDPTEWIRRQATEKGERFIVVTGNYRVNIFGFFSGVDVLADSKDGLSGNYGLYDAVKIFEWVRLSLSAFVTRF